MARDDLSLRQAAEKLNVHYMTVYRYVRLGQLPATKEGAQWRVSPKDVDAFRSVPSARGRADWHGRLHDRLVNGDEAGAWQVIESALASGREPTEIHLDVIAPALRRIGDLWHRGRLDIAIEHRASAITARLVGRLGALMRPRGRRRGTIVLGSPSGERHSLPLAIVADVMRASGWEVMDLGCDVPDDSFALAVENATRLRAVGVGVSSEGSVDSAKRLIARLRPLLPEEGSLLVGGTAVTSAEALGADFHARDATAAVDFLADGR
jgi:excisionase family DNA binding protein